MPTLDKGCFVYIKKPIVNIGNCESVSLEEEFCFSASNAQSLGSFALQSLAKRVPFSCGHWYSGCAAPFTASTILRNCYPHPERHKTLLLVVESANKIAHRSFASNK